MITIDLEKLFKRQARADHLQRMQSLLTALDFDHAFSKAPDFQSSLVSKVDALASQGVRDSYMQACALFGMFAAQVELPDGTTGDDSKAWVLKCMQVALSRGVPASAFHVLFESLSGLGQIDQAWPCVRTQINLMDLLEAVHPDNHPSLIQCDQSGPLVPDAAVMQGDMANVLRTESGFVHNLFGVFTPEYLITEVCKSGLPVDVMQINVDPIFERCEFGRQDKNGYHCLQRIELLDTRVAKLTLNNKSLSCSLSEKQSIQSAWLDSKLLTDPSFFLSDPWLDVDLSFRGQWCLDQGAMSFQTQAQMQIRAFAEGVKWQASMIHNSVLVNICIRAQRDIQIHWEHSDRRKPGQLPLGEPIWIAQQKVPLHAHFSSVVGVGKPVIQAVSPLVGELVFTVSTALNPANRLLEITLTVDHSELALSWQSVDPVKGRTSGQWLLAPARRMMKKALQHG